MPTAQDQYDDAMFDFSQSEYDQAITKLKALLAEDGDNFDARLALGMAYYRKGDYAEALAETLDALGIEAPMIERLVARSLEAPASRFMRMRRTVDLLVSDSAAPGTGALIEGTYQTPILVQWRSAKTPARKIEVSLTRFS